MPIMPPPLATLATHIITVTNAATGQDRDYGYDPDYAGAMTAYYGIVQDMGGSEDDEGQIYADGTYTVMVFSTPSPAIKTQAELGWASLSLFPGLVPKGFVKTWLPIALPPNWSPETIAMAITDQRGRNTARWLVTATDKNGAMAATSVGNSVT